MRSFLFVMYLGVAACGVDSGPEPDSGPVTDLERRELGISYDVTTRTVSINDDESLAAIRRVGGPTRMEGTIVADDDPIVAQDIMGSDGRTQVTPTTFFPVAARVRLALEFSDGYTSNGSGHLVGNKYVITAGHVVYSADHGGWATKITAFPGQDGNSKPFGGGVSTDLRTTQGWVNDQDDDVDYGLITLDTNLGDQIGWFGLEYFSDSELDANPQVTVAGYPVDKPWGTQWTMSGAIQNYSIDTFGGESGAGVAHILNGRHYVTGVHHGSGYYWLSYYNQATRITGARFNQILGWVASGT